MGKLHLIKILACRGYGLLTLCVLLSLSIPAQAQGDIELTPPPASGAATPELSGCATDTWAAMVNQAVMQTRREDILNKRFIVKPDSVLQYSCFRDPLRRFAWEVPRIFSNGDQWSNREVDILADEPLYIKIYEKDYPEVEENYNIGSWQSPSLEEALTLMVDEAMVRYINQHYDHRILAGATGLGQASDVCVSMEQMWQSAKCKNFDGTQVFYTFEDLINFDPREFPPNMPCTP